MALTTTAPILVFGESGQVARDLRLLAAGSAEPPFVFAGRERCDLLRADPCELIAFERPRAVVNAAAYTAVDRAESEPEAAYRLNRDAPAAMAQACAALDVPFVHMSTDYVFDGRKDAPYEEDDHKGPLSVYGASKLAGEEAVAAVGGRWTILRTAWVVSPFGANFVKTMLRLGRDRQELGVVDDQRGRPTLSADIAAMALKIAKDPGTAAQLHGVFHLAGAGDASWADVADHVFAAMAPLWGQRPRIRRIATSEYPTPANRPSNSRLATGKLEGAAAWTPRPWTQTIDICLAGLAQEPAG
jgi:dTDP-4-dehydrorhamnose reductase